jgi:hypothetical protein
MVLDPSTFHHATPMSHQLDGGIDLLARDTPEPYESNHQPEPLAAVSFDNTCGRRLGGALVRSFGADWRRASRSLSSVTRLEKPAPVDTPRSCSTLADGATI